MDINELKRRTEEELKAMRKDRDCIDYDGDGRVGAQDTNPFTGVRKKKDEEQFADLDNDNLVGPADKRPYNNDEIIQDEDMGF